jgi:hypothetical protein
MGIAGRDGLLWRQEVASQSLAAIDFFGGIKKDSPWHLCQGEPLLSYHFSPLLPAVISPRQGPISSPTSC